MFFVCFFIPFLHILLSYRVVKDYEKLKRKKNEVYEVYAAGYEIIDFKNTSKYSALLATNRNFIKSVFLCLIIVELSDYSAL